MTYFEPRSAGATSAPDADPETNSDVAVGPSALLPDPRHLAVAFWRRLWLFLIVAAFVLGGVIAYVAITPKRYSATSNVLIESRRSDPIAQNGQPMAEQAPTSDFIDTQILIISSPQIATKVVQALNLVEDPEFGARTANLPEGSVEALRQARLAQSAAAVARAVRVRRTGQTALIEIVATSLSPTEAARIANEFAKQYLAAIEESRAVADRSTNEKVDSKLVELRQQAERADADLQRYKIANGLLSAQGATMAEQETSTLNQQIAGARVTLAERQGRLAEAKRQLQQGGGGGDVSSALNSGTIGALRQSEAEASRELAQLRARYGDRHPQILQQQQKLADVRQQIQLEIDRILSNLSAEVNVAQSGLNSLLQSQSQARARLAGNTASQVGYSELDRRASAAKTVYEAFLASSKGTTARAGILPPDASISGLAEVPTVPSSPNTRLAYLLGAVFALLAGLLAVVIAEFLDGGIRTKLDVERRLGARYLGAVPEVSSTLDGMRNIEAPQDYIVSHPLSTFAEALRNLRSSLTLGGNRRPKVLAITSPLPREGKTTTAVCLARTLAMSGASTVIVDCDLRRHSTSDLLLAGRPGRLLDLLSREASLDEALLRDTDTELMILGLSDAPSDGRDWLAPTLTAPLFAALRERFDYVVIDTAPVLGIADARAIASQADAVLLLARWRKTSMRAADTALDLLLDAKAKVAGVALTLVDIRKYASTGTEDLYGYHKKFKGYYVN